MSTPEAQRKASNDHRARRKAAGYRVIGFELSPEALSALDKLAVNGVSKAQAVNAAIISAANEKALREAGAVAVRDRVVVGEMSAAPTKPLNVADELRAMAVRDNEPGPITKEIQKAALSAVQVGPSPFKPRLKGKAK